MTRAFAAALAAILLVAGCGNGDSKTVTVKRSGPDQSSGAPGGGFQKSPDSGPTEEAPSQGEGEGDTGERVEYDVTLTGQTAYGEFERQGRLVVEPRVEPAGDANFDNGENVREVGLFSGNPPGTPEQGAIWFATNTTLFREEGFGSVNQGLAGLDVAYVEGDESHLDVTIDGDFYGLPAARSSQLNCMNARGGLTAGIYQLIRGGMQLDFSDDGSVSGSIDMTGNGYVEPGESPYSAQLSGSRRG